MNDNKTGIIFIGQECSNRCVFCQNTFNKQLSAGELRRQEAKACKDLEDYQNEGCSSITITGSDPLGYKKLIPMVEYIKKLGFSDIILCTHGRVAQDDKIMEKLADAGISSFRIPLYGSNAKIHDSVTRSNGSFEETIKGIKSIKNIKKQVRLTIITAILNQNKDDIPRILKLAFSFKPDNFQFDTIYLYPSVRDISSYVPYRDLGRHIKRAADYAYENNIKNIQFNDIPYCVFGFDSELVVMPKHFAELKKWKIKPEICNQCKLKGECDGFYFNDIKRFGTGGLKPII